MKMYLYVVRDTVAGESSPVYESKNDAVARRAFEKLFAQDDVHKSEFLLMKVGKSIMKRTSSRR